MDNAHAVDQALIVRCCQAARNLAAQSQHLRYAGRLGPRQSLPQAHPLEPLHRQKRPFHSAQRKPGK
jgi:hypothetical protein